MAVYTWNGYNEKGKDSKGMIDASSLKEAKLKLRSQGVFVTAIAEDSPAVAAQSSAREISLSSLFVRVNLEDVTVMTRQLSTLVGASIPLVDALNALYEQTESPPLKKTIAQVRDSVNEGAAFADALARHKRVFPDLYVNMVRSGESSGAKTRPLAGVTWGQFEHHAELDFSSFKTPGRYVLRLGEGQSLPFTISDAAYRELPDQLLEFMRQQRCGYNPWLDAVCHPFDGRTAYGPLTNGTHLDASGGWHDAADLLKYLLTSGNATAQMLLAYELAGNRQQFADKVNV